MFICICIVLCRFARLFVHVSMWKQTADVSSTYHKTFVSYLLARVIGRGFTIQLDAVNSLIRFILRCDFTVSLTLAIKPSSGIDYRAWLHHTTKCWYTIFWQDSRTWLQRTTSHWEAISGIDSRMQWRNMGRRPTAQGAGLGGVFAPLLEEAQKAP